jgi:hypothetical protein
MTITLTSVPNAQQITVTLSDVEDAFGQTMPNATVSMNVLKGDTTGNKAVTASDIGETKTESGNPVGEGNFRADVNANGSINSSDIGLVKAASGTNIR